MQDTVDLDQKRKQRFFGFCAWITILAFTILSWIDFMEGDTHENWINLMVMLVMAAGLVAVKKLNAKMSVYRITMLLASLLFLHTVTIGAGKETVLYWGFVFPLLFFYFFNKKEGLIWAAAFALVLCIVMLVPRLFGGYLYSRVMISRFFITLFFVSLVAYGLEASRHTFSRLLDEKNLALRREKEQLEEALANIRSLRGLLPMCASCKRIRDDQGYWNQLESYFSEHSDVVFSHSICPECKKKLYPDL